MIQQQYHGLLIHSVWIAMQDNIGILMLLAENRRLYQSHVTATVQHPTITCFLYGTLCVTVGFEADTATASSVATRTLLTGESCAVNSGCCHLVGAPWFYRVYQLK